MNDKPAMSPKKKMLAFIGAVGVVLVALIVVLRLTVFRPKRRYGSSYTGTRRPRNYKGGRRRK